MQKRSAIGTEEVKFNVVDCFGCVDWNAQSPFFERHETIDNDVAS